MLDYPLMAILFKQILELKISFYIYEEGGEERGCNELLYCTLREEVGDLG